MGDVHMTDHEMRVSIIIPIYNTARYLRRCLDSVICQTYRNLEIILVDDGSTDTSPQICDEYASRDDRIKVVHKSNGGESSARNVGLKISSGDCIAFLDCDDWIESDMYEVLVSAMEKNDADIAASSWIKEFPEKQVKVCNIGTVSHESFGRKEMMHYVYKRDMYQGFAYMWDKLYKREILEDDQKHIMMFDESLELGGDVLYLAKALLNTKNACYIDKNFYHYRQRADSGSHAVDLKKRMDWLMSYNMTIDLFESNSVDEETLVYVKRFLVYHSTDTAEIALDQGNTDELAMCLKNMRLYQNEYRMTNAEYPDRIEWFENTMKRAEAACNEVG